ncbi:DUF262 domain-containing protein [Bacteroides fragilis]
MAELNVSRKNIQGLLSLNDPTTKGKIFVIPEYQRPYRWEVDTCDVLWNDLKNFLKNIKMMIGNIFLVRLLLVMIQMNKTALILLMGSSV